MSGKERRETILNTVDDMISCLLYYDRKEDEDLPVGAIEQAIMAGEVNADELVLAFKGHLDRAVEAARKAQ